MRLTILLACFSFFIKLSAQEKSAPADIYSGAFADKGIYRFPAFTEGTVVFRNGNVMTVKLNYNITMDEMHFISAKGDTLAVADPPVISYISIAPYRFYYDKGYLQAIAKPGDGLVLAFKQVLVKEEGTKGAFGIATTHPGATSYDYFTLKGQQYSLGNEENPVSAKETYFFGDNFGHFSKASKEYILVRYEKKQDAVKNFLKTNHTSFNKEDDLLKLLQFCGQLQ